MGVLKRDCSLCDSFRLLGCSPVVDTTDPPPLRCGDGATRLLLASLRLPHHAAKRPCARVRAPALAFLKLLCRSESLVWIS